MFGGSRSDSVDLNPAHHSIGAGAGADAAPFTIPDPELLFHGDFKRAGTDLKIIGENGNAFVVHDYFKTDRLPTLYSPSGAALTGDIVAALAGPLAPGQYAQAGGTPAASEAHPIGRVATVSGNATAVRNGVAVALNVGDAVYKGDVIQTAGDSAVGVIFTDNTTFNLNANARMVLNEFVYDPNGSANSAAINLVQGTISFLAGAVAHTGDMKIGTPVGTMGIRGTAVNVTISADNGTTNISVMAEADNLTHTVAVYALPTSADLAAGQSTGALLGVVTNNSGIYHFDPTPTGIVVQEIGKDPAVLQHELAIVQQVFQTQAVGQQFLQVSPDTQHAAGTQIITSVTLVSHDSGSTGTTTTTTTAKVTIGDQADTNTDSQNGPNHTNSPPVANPDVNTVVEAGVKPTNVPFAGTPTATGNVLANDTDPDSVSGDTKTVVNVSAVSAQLHGTLTLDADGTYTYTLDNNNPLTQALAVGETADDVFSYTISDRDGAQSTSTLTITVMGTDDAPVIAVADLAQTASITEQIHQTDLAALDVQTGTIHFTDVDLSDRPTATIAGQTITYLAADGHSVQTLSPTEASDIVAAFSIAAEAGNANDGTIDWTYSIQDQNLDFLAKNETVTLTSTILVDDHHGGTDTSTITITITGTNDDPTIVSSTGDHPGLTEDGTISASGLITFRDVDLTDAHAVSQALTAGSITSTLPGFDPATQQLGTLTLIKTENTADTVNTGTVGWTFDADNALLQQLAVGQIVTQTYTVSVDDGHGGTPATQTIVITITGTNDDPTIVSSTGDHPGLTEDGTISASGLITFRDVDLTDAHAVSQALTAGSITSTLPGFDPATQQLGTLTLIKTENTADTVNTGTVGWTFDADNALLQQLAVGQIVTQTYTVSVDDGHGGTPATQTIVITITGTNDDPTIVSSTGDHPGLTEDGTISASGLITFRDVDLTDAHAVSQALTAGSITSTLPGFDPATQQLGTLTLIKTENTADTVNTGTVGWTFDADNALLQQLAVGQIVTQTYTVSVDDGHGGTPATQTIVITITGTNDDPTIVSSTGDHPGLTEDGTISASGLITFRDVDLTDAHAVSQALTAGSITSTLPGFDPATQQLGTLTLIKTENTADTVNTGTVGWTFDADNALLQQLAVGQIVTQTYTVSVDDGHGGTPATQTIVITITGTNDDPTIVSSTGDHPGLTEDGTISASGLITFRDVDLTDAHAVSQTLTAGSITSTLPGFDPATQQLGTLTLIKTENTADTVNTGTVGWTFDADNALLQQLAVGQIVTQTYTVSVDDGHGGTPATQTIVITITGTNDDPTIVSSTGDHPGLTEDGTISASGLITFRDVDLTDAHAVSQALTAGSITSTLPGFDPATQQLGTLTLIKTENTADTVNTGTVGWTFDADNALLQQLAVGQIVTQTYTVSVDDGHGGTPATQTIVITITGTNDDPTIVSSTGDHPGLTEDGTISASGLITFRDVDLTDAHAVSQALTAGSITSTLPGFDPATQQLGTLTLIKTENTADTVNTGTVGWTFDADNALLQQLAVGQIVTQTYTVSVDDGHGGTPATQTIVITITGTNDDPTIVSSTGDHPGLTEDGTISASGLITFRDVDLTDAHAVSQALTAGSITSTLPGFDPATQQLGTLTLIKTENTADTVNTGTVGWTFDADNALLQQLAVGQIVTQTYTVSVDDGHGGTPATQTIVITITGTNDDPTIVSSTGDHPGLTEDGTISASGLITFRDVDLTDAHAVSQALTAGSITSTLPGFDPATQQLGTLTLIKTENTADTVNTGTVGWTFDADNALLQQLAVGQIVTQTYTVSVDDGHGGTPATQTIVITITGTNDDPTIVSSTGDHPGLTEDGTISASGLITFRDVDLTDAHAVSQALTAGSITSTLPGFDPATQQLGTLTLIKTENTADTVNTGTVGWTFDADNALLQQLAVGQIVTQTYTVSVDDGHGGTPATQTIVITITGTNDDPTIVSSTGDHPGLTEDGTISASGLITFRDVDLTDAHAVSQALTAGSITSTLPGFDPATQQLGTLTLIKTENTADTVNTGTVGWTFDADNALLQQLAVGQIVTQTYTVSVDDGHGGTPATQTIVITITGTNDDPTIVSSTGDHPGLTEDGTISASGLITFRDVDLTDAHAVSQALTAGSITSTLPGFDPATQQLGTLTLIKTENTADTVNTGTVGWTFDADNALLQQLAVGQIVTQTYTVSVDDGHGGTPATQTIVITITGTNDDPTIVSSTGDHPGLTEDGTISASGLITFRDVDLTDAHAVSQALTAGSITSTLPGFDPATQQLGTLTLIKTENTADTVNTGTVGWTFDADNALLQQLAVGQIVTQTYTVSVDDGHGGTPATQTIVITITGTNDDPTIVSSTGDHPGLTEDGTISASGLITFRDVDLTDAHAVSQALTAGSITSTLPGFDPATQQLGTLTLIKTENTADTVNTGTVGWTFDADNALLQQLAVGQIVTQTYTVSVDDGHGGTPATQTIVITITGTNDAAVVAGDTSGTVVEAGGVNNSIPGTPIVTGTLTDTDVDNPANTFQAILTAASSAHGYGTYTVDASGHWSYTLDNNNSSVQALNTGQYLTDTFNVLTQDGTTQTVTITIAGTDDGPVTWAGDTLYAYTQITSVDGAGHTTWQISGFTTLTSGSSAHFPTFDLSIASTSITATFLASGAWSGTSNVTFNGLIVSDGTQGDISGVTIDPSTNMVGLKLSDISFTSNTVIVNWEGLSFTPGTVVKLDLTFDPQIDPAQFGVIPTLDGTASPVHNADTLTVADGTALYLAGVIDNTGVIAVDALHALTAIGINGDVTLQGGGHIDLSASNQNYVFGSDATLTNVDNTISGGGDFGNGALVFHNAGVVEALGPYALIIDTGTNTFVNTGTLETGGGTLQVHSAVTGGGKAIITGGTLEFFGASDNNVIFTAGSSGYLALDLSQSFTGHIANFGAQDQIDLSDIVFSSNTTLDYAANADGAGGVLTVGDGTHTAHLGMLGDYTAESFESLSDQHGGTLLVEMSNAAGQVVGDDSTNASGLVAGSQNVAQGDLNFAGLDPAGSPTASFAPEGVGYIGDFTLGPITQNDGSATVGFEFSLGSDHILAPGEILTQAYDVTVADAVNPIAAVSQAITVSIGGPGDDNFVFHPGIGADVIMNFNPAADTIELDNFANFQTVEQLLSFITTDAHGNAVIGLGHNDSITLAGTTVDQLQHVLATAVHLQ